MQSIFDRHVQFVWVSCEPANKRNLAQNLIPCEWFFVCRLLLVPRIQSPVSDNAGHHKFANKVPWHEIGQNKTSQRQQYSHG